MEVYLRQKPAEDPIRVFASNELNWLPSVIAPTPHPSTGSAGSHLQRPVRFKAPFSAASAHGPSEATPTTTPRASSRARTALSQPRTRKREPLKASYACEYACPFAKHKGDGNYECTGTAGNLKIFRGTGLHRVKEHVRTVHLRHLKCSHDGCSFRTGRVSDLNDHQNLEKSRCPSQYEFDPVDSDTEAKGIRVDKLKGFKGRPKAGGHVGYTWPDLYRALFPETAPVDVPSPWYEGGASLRSIASPSTAAGNSTSTAFAQIGLAETPSASPVDNLHSHVEASLNLPSTDAQRIANTVFQPPSDNNCQDTEIEWDTLPEFACNTANSLDRLEQAAWNQVVDQTFGRGDWTDSEISEHFPPYIRDADLMEEMILNPVDLHNLANTFSDENIDPALLNL
ncbi:hypothetical protein RUND412_007889 [Rhizina undulata]